MCELRVCEAIFLIFINKAEYWISKNRIMDIQKSNNGYTKKRIIHIKNLAEFWISISGQFVQNRITDIQKSNNRYPKIKLWIFKNQIIDIKNLAEFLDIHYSIFGYP